MSFVSIVEYMHDLKEELHLDELTTKKDLELAKVTDYNKKARPI